MKLLIAILILAVIILQEWNISRINSLQQQISTLQTRISKEEARVHAPPPSPSDFAMKAARDAMNQAQSEIRNTNLAQAKRNLDLAGARLDEAIQYAGKSAGPAMDWMKQRLQSLNSQLESRLKSK